ncbi:MAG: hypothetical protein AB7N71_12135 [Phycisphaerae bacterium]
MYEDVGEANRFDLPLYACPSDTGLAENAALYPAGIAKKSLYDVSGVSYAVAFNGGGASTRIALTSSPIGHKFDSLIALNELVLVAEPRFDTALNFGIDVSTYEPSPFMGWHKRANSDNLLFCDGSVRATQLEDLVRPSDSDLHMMGVDAASWAPHLLYRGRTFRYDSYPTPGALLFDTLSNTQARNALVGQYGNQWPTRGLQDNYQDNR